MIHCRALESLDEEIKHLQKKKGDDCESDEDNQEDSAS